ncbi:MAG: hypothetical protein WBG58_06555 [Ignavibacteriaceae bacterium]
MMNLFYIFLVWLLIHQINLFSQQLSFDHLFILVGESAPSVKILVDAGLKNDPDTLHHTGQGTSAVFFNFNNFYVELMWISHKEEAEKPGNKIIDMFLDQKRGGSPFGFVVARSSNETDSIPYLTESMYADWLRPNESIKFALSDDIMLPSIIVVPRYLDYDSINVRYPEAIRELIDHPIGSLTLTSIRFRGPRSKPESTAIIELVRQGIAEFVEDKNHLVELIFNNGKSGKRIDVRPNLPLIIYY